ncbi:MAG: hypothetical protein ACLUAR_16915 [Pilosibacter sp.]
MKKKFPTFIDEAALNYETIAVSASQERLSGPAFPAGSCGLCRGKTSGSSAKLVDITENVMETTQKWELNI